MCCDVLSLRGAKLHVLQFRPALPCLALRPCPSQHPHHATKTYGHPPRRHCAQPYRKDNITKTHASGAPLGGRRLVALAVAPDLERRLHLARPRRLLRALAAARRARRCRAHHCRAHRVSGCTKLARGDGGLAPAPVGPPSAAPKSSVTEPPASSSGKAAASATPSTVHSCRLFILSALRCIPSQGMGCPCASAADTCQHARRAKLDERHGRGAERRGGGAPAPRRRPSCEHPLRRPCGAWRAAGAQLPLPSSAIPRAGGRRA